MSAIRRHILAWPAALLAVMATACLDDRSVSPNEVDGASVRLGLNAMIVGAVAGQTVQIRAFYQRTDQTEITLSSSPTSVSVTPGVAQQVAVVVRVAECLADPQQAGGTSSRCAVGIALTLVDENGTPIDEQTVPPKQVPPGTTTVPDPIVFAPVAQVSFGTVPVLRVGDNRTIYTLTDPTGQKQVAGPNRTLTVGYAGPNGETIAPQPQTFIWAIEGVNGVYVGHTNFPTAGNWTAKFSTSAPGSPVETSNGSFPVAQTVNVVSPGDPAPSVKTPTLADVGGDVSKVSSDPNPVKAFYQTSEDAALAAHKPFVLIFATPKFCQSAVCGPTLDKLKPVAAAHPEMTFINVEPYQLDDSSGTLQPVLTNGALTPVPATDAFKLSVEPYVFVVGADGKVSSSFELVFSPEEIGAAIKAVENG